ncbi:MAG: hypothetical protein RJA13_1259 [Bacteroidota bacterium]
MDQTSRKAINIALVNKKLNRISLPLHLKCLNFKEKSGNSDTNKRLIKTIKQDSLKQLNRTRNRG